MFPHPYKAEGTQGLIWVEIPPPLGNPRDFHLNLMLGNIRLREHRDDPFRVHITSLQTISIVPLHIGVN